MNREETVALFMRGQTAWNDWARTLLEEKQVAVTAGTFSGDLRIEWENRARVDFTSHPFIVAAHFKGCVFPSHSDFTSSKFFEEAEFEEATFHDNARFDSASFAKMAWFDSAIFKANAWFESAVFGKNVSFNEVDFKDDASFEKAKFDGEALFEEAKLRGDVSFLRAVLRNTSSFDYAEIGGEANFANATFEAAASFNRCTFFEGANFRETVFDKKVSFAHTSFGGPTSFAEARFNADPSFVAMRCESSFALPYAEFLLPPDFAQAHFDEAPNLERLYIRNRWADKDSPSRWRSLGRLANQGLDHERELRFFAEEMKAHRHRADHPFPSLQNYLRRSKQIGTGERKDVWVWSAGDRARTLPVWTGVSRYWVGMVYQATSDFGRSISLPILWWCVGVLVFAVIYLFGGHLGDANPLALLQAPCEDSTETQSATALTLSFSRALIFSGLSNSDAVGQSYHCLFGDSTSGSTITPNWAILVGYVQTVFSIVMLFLAGLGLRNNFRIR